MRTLGNLRATVSTWLLVALVALAVLPGAAAARQATPAATPSDPLAASVAWLLAQQDASGGFPGLSGELDPGVTTDAALALAAVASTDPAAPPALDRAVAYLAANGEAYAQTGPGQAAKLALAAVAGGHDPRSFAGFDLFTEMQNPPTTTVEHPIAGIWGDSLYAHALVMLAFSSVGELVPDAALEPLRATQSVDGGWAFDGSTSAGAADSNTTSLVIQALVAAGFDDSDLIPPAIAFLQTLRAPDGSGYAYGPGEPLTADANSTALVVQALIATGADPGEALTALAAFQLPDGSLRWQQAESDPNLLATLQGIPALAQKPLPVVTACPADSDASDDCVQLAA
ncbi:MAG: hypothetical protein KC442_16770 [Thermomicrobiales bacterium]|nr:hypothetical protein [Thermomicrobiales bacterium]